MFMCKPDWFLLPKAMRDEIWLHYVPGQEVTKTPSREYLDIARRCVEYLEKLDT